MLPHPSDSIAIHYPSASIRFMASITPMIPVEGFNPVGSEGFGAFRPFLVADVCLAHQYTPTLNNTPSQR